LKLKKYFRGFPHYVIAAHPILKAAAPRLGTARLLETKIDWFLGASLAHLFWVVRIPATPEAAP
jgi:hypothetical protein